MQKELKSKRVTLLTTQRTFVDMKKLATMNEVSLNEMVNEALRFYVNINRKSIERYNNFFCVEDGELFTYEGERQ